MFTSKSTIKSFKLLFTAKKKLKKKFHELLMGYVIVIMVLNMWEMEPSVN